MSADARPVELVITPAAGLRAVDWRELWAYRELFGFLVWRDIAVRYKQSLLGVLWALVTPTITIVIFTLIFGRLAKIPTDGVPYPIFAIAGLLPWLFFAQSLQKASLSMVAERGLLTKVYFPRLMVPLAATLAPLVDLLIASSLVAAMLTWYGIAPALPEVLLLPLCIAWAWLTAVGVGTWLSALNVYFRDVGQMIPFLVQVWMYASPVVYPTSLVPEEFRWLYFLNPMAGVIEAVRFTLFAQGGLDATQLAVSAAGSLLLFVTGMLFFLRMERSFADVV